MTKMRAVLVILGLMSTLAVASAIKVWSPGDVLSTTDLNANFSHIHSLMVGGHGARLVDADVSGSAALSHSKLATPGVVAKSVIIVGAGTSTPCTAGTCSLAMSAGSVPTVTWVATGRYSLVYSARSDAYWGLTVTPLYCGAAAAGCWCNVQTGVSTTSATVECFSATLTPTIAGVNAVFTAVLWDNNN